MIDVSVFAKTLNGRPVAVFGLGISNHAVVAALKKAGATFVIDDDDKTKSTADFLKEDLSHYACLVLSPGVRLDHSVVQKAKAAGLEILCDIEILHRCKHGRKTIGITGTNGKSTTTALIGHILNQNGIGAAVGGNIGHAALALDMPPPNGVFVLELSSYQLELCPTFAPDIAVLLNITPDHLDHHGSMENYIAAKARLFRGSGTAIVLENKETLNPHLQKKYERTEQNLSLPEGFNNLSLPGAHNRQNAAAAFAACRALGLDEAVIMRAINSFPGLPHRQQIVRTMGNVTYINDSKATNADAAAKALVCCRDIYWIAGGRPKEGGLDGVEPYLDRVKKAFLIGEAQDDFSRFLAARGIPHEKCGTLESAVAAAHGAAKAGVVLLSPACASFDQFRNFEHRGEAFIALVNGLKEEAA